MGMASQFSKAKVAKAQRTRASVPASATPSGMTTTSLPLTAHLLTHLCLPFQLHARAQLSSAHFLELVSSYLFQPRNAGGILLWHYDFKTKTCSSFFPMWTMSKCTVAYIGCACSIFLVSVDS